jgi:hypothetical protein
LGDRPIPAACSEILERRQLRTQVELVDEELVRRLSLDAERFGRLGRKVPDVERDDGLGSRLHRRGEDAAVSSVIRHRFDEGLVVRNPGFSEAARPGGWPVA